MKKHKKVCYRFEKNIIDLLENRSMYEGISKSKLVSFYIQKGYELMVEEYHDSDAKPIKTIKKRKNTIPKTYTIPSEVEYTLSWFSDKLDIKKSHLVMACIVNFERELEKKEEEKLSREIDELMEKMEKLSL